MRKDCPNKKENEKDCTCQETDCERHGVCCECIKHHREDGGKPACIR